MFSVLERYVFSSAVFNLIPEVLRLRPCGGHMAVSGMYSAVCNIPARHVNIPARYCPLLSALCRPEAHSLRVLSVLDSVTFLEIPRGTGHILARTARVPPARSGRPVSL